MNNKTSNENWKIGDKVIHKGLGAGEITHVFVAGKKVSVVIKFTDLGQIITDPASEFLEKLSSSNC